MSSSGASCYMSTLSETYRWADGTSPHPVRSYAILPGNSLISCKLPLALEDRDGNRRRDGGRSGGIDGGSRQCVVPRRHAAPNIVKGRRSRFADRRSIGREHHFDDLATRLGRVRLNGDGGGWVPNIAGAIAGPGDLNGERRVRRPGDPDRHGK